MLRELVKSKTIERRTHQITNLSPYELANKWTHRTNELVKQGSGVGGTDSRATNNPNLT